MSAITSNAAEFMRENTKSPVVIGTVVGRGGDGAFYTLANGKLFKLTAEECSQVAPIKWKGMDQ